MLENLPFEGLLVNVPMPFSSLIPSTIFLYSIMIFNTESFTFRISSVKQRSEYDILFEQLRAKRSLHALVVVILKEGMEVDVRKIRENFLLTNICCFTVAGTLLKRLVECSYLQTVLTCSLFVIRN